ncbi:Tryptophan-associated transmembrane protein [Corynebacterium kalinowskii]|uniref:Tryptophan-associated transmembrane protein n=1 Tax=Corynebacterium kalinowskii TaxID=2675216 RepID=A0A6B8VR42_9CORY|nr:TIGR02234 family membrane protein [Corynebacterium kalinowskii]QGU02331.1 Tryptophan-associated transmembrane protein [Corynebacterium kalinowskii]
MRKLATAGLALSAIAMWAASRLTWLEVSVFDDKSGDAHHQLVGAVWSTETTAVALLLLAAVVAMLALRRLGRRIVAAIAALAAAAASWQPLQLLLYGADPLRTKELLTSGAASQQQNKPVTVTEWAQITDISVSAAGPVLTLVGCAVGLLAGIVLVMKPGEDSVRKSKYELKQAREEKLADELNEDPDSPRLMWDALDADVDPTANRRDF